MGKLCILRPYRELIEKTPIKIDKKLVSIPLHACIGSLGLADFFSCTILSYQVGVRKPDKFQSPLSS
jgi:hypothetical protein